MKTQAQHDARLKMETVEQSELSGISGGVMPVYDEQGNIIRTCTGPVFFPDSRLPIYGPIRLR